MKAVYYRNIVAFICLALFFYGYVELASRYVPEHLRIEIGVVGGPLVIGVVGYFLFNARVWLRLGLLFIVPLAVALILPGDPAYPWFSVLSGALFAIVIVVGGGLGVGIARFRSRFLTED